MGKNVLIISTSPRRGSNSEMLASAFAAGAGSAGHQVEQISLADKDIRFCRGCFACHTTGSCVIQDDATQIAGKMERADVLVFATPIYYYEMSGQMKTMLDRGNPMYVKDYAFRDVYFLATAAEEGERVWSRAAAGLEGWIECFPKARLAGVVFGGNANEVGTVGKEALRQAEELGRRV